MISRFIRTFSFLSVFAASGTGPLAAQSSLEYEVKAAFLYNFVRFIDWPEAVFAEPREPFVIGVLAREDPFEGKLETAVRGRTIDGRPLEVRFAQRLEGLAGAHLVYVSSTAPESQTDILAAFSGSPVVTVGETPDFTAAGGIVRFFVRERKIAFEINPRAAERGGLRVSSRLLSLADVYREASAENP